MNRHCNFLSTFILDMAIGGRPEPEFLLLAGFAVMVNVLAQGAPLRFTQ